MNIKSVTSSNNSFKGLLTISGPKKENDVVINTDNISTIVKHSYIDKKEDTTFGIGFKDGSVITMNNGTSINVFLPTESIVDAYKKATVTNEHKIETKFDPLITKPIF